jgi:hypothetical protein
VKARRGAKSTPEARQNQPAGPSDT